MSRELHSRTLAYFLSAATESRQRTPAAVALIAATGGRAVEQWKDIVKHFSREETPKQGISSREKCGTRPRPKNSSSRGCATNGQKKTRRISHRPFCEQFVKTRHTSYALRQPGPEGAPRRCTGRPGAYSRIGRSGTEAEMAEPVGRGAAAQQRGAQLLYLSIEMLQPYLIIFSCRSK
jgi:hypothetical protein